MASVTTEFSLEITPKRLFLKSLSISYAQTPSLSLLPLEQNSKSHVMQHLISPSTAKNQLSSAPPRQASSYQILALAKVLAFHGLHSSSPRIAASFGGIAGEPRRRRCGIGDAGPLRSLS